MGWAHLHIRGPAWLWASEDRLTPVCPPMEGVSRPGRAVSLRIGRDARTRDHARPPTAGRARGVQSESCPESNFPTAPPSGRAGTCLQTIITRATHPRAGVRMMRPHSNPRPRATLRKGAIRAGVAEQPLTGHNQIDLVAVNRESVRTEDEVLAAKRSR